MRVLHLVHSLNPGGVETTLVRLMQHIPRSRIAMDVCCRDTGLGVFTDDAIATGAKVVSAQWANVRSAPWKVLQTGFVRRLTNILKKGHYDLLHVHVQFVSGLATYAAKSAGVPLVLTIHRSTFEPDSTFSTNWFLRAAYQAYFRMNLYYSIRHAAHVSANSQAAMDRMVGSVAHGDRFSVMNYGVVPSPSASTAERASFRNELGWDPDCPLILHVGRFDAGKNQRGVVQVFQRVLANQPTARLILVGDGPLRPAILEFVDRQLLTPYVRWLGMRRDVPSIMSRSDVLLFPSYTESLPAVTLEAAAAGLPIVASRIPGMNEAVRDGITALLHPVDDHAAMAASVSRLLSDPLLAAEFRRNAQWHAEECFSFQASADRLERLYLSLVPQRTLVSDRAAA